MKTLVKGLTALLICGSFIFSSCENVEAAEVADLTTNSVETQELARRPHRPPSPPPPGRPGSHHKDPWDRHPHRPTIGTDHITRHLLHLVETDTDPRLRRVMVGNF